MQMGWRLSLVALGLIALTACKDQEARDQIAALNAEMTVLQEWLGAGGTPMEKGDKTVHAWHQFVRTAICNLEKKALQPGDNTDRLCDPDIDHSAPPNPPPWGT